MDEGGFGAGLGWDGNGLCVVYCINICKRSFTLR